MVTNNWKLYQKGIEYNDSLEYVTKVQTNERFVSGDQWKGVKANGLPTPVFNIIKRPLYHFIAYLISSPRKIKFTSNNEDLTLLNRIIEKNWELDKVDDKIKIWLRDAGVSGDMVGHMYWDTSIENENGIMGDYSVECVDGTNVFLGNANTKIINKRGKMFQPYVLITGREFVSKLKEEAKENKIPQAMINNIRSDEDNDKLASELGSKEVETEDKKATYIIKYWYNKDTKTVHWNKETQNATIVKDKDTKIKMCPILFENWEPRKNSYHGEAFCTQLIPAQKFINKQYAIAMIHSLLEALPIRIYDKTRLQKLTNQAGASIGVNGDPTNVIKTVEGSPVPETVMSIIDRAKQSTNESIGVNDVMLGNVTPTNATAIVQIVEQSSTTLLNQSTALNNFLEQYAEIAYEFIKNYYGEVGRNVYDDETKSSELFIASDIKGTPRPKIEVGSSRWWSENASIQTLDNMFSKGVIDIIQYLERLPDDIIPRKDELIEALKVTTNNVNPLQNNGNQVPVPLNSILL